MKKNYIKFLTLLICVSLSVGQSVFAADGVDIKEFKRIKNVKNIFHKKDNKAPKSLKLEETPLDDSTFSTFEETDLDMYGSSMKELEPQEEQIELKVKNKKPKKQKKLFNFKRKNKNIENNEPELIEEETLQPEKSGEPFRCGEGIGLGQKVAVQHPHQGGTLAGKVLQAQ